MTLRHEEGVKPTGIQMDKTWNVWPLHRTTPYLRASSSNAKSPLVKLRMESICSNYRESFVKL